MIIRLYQWHDVEPQKQAIFNESWQIAEVASHQSSPLPQTEWYNHDDSEDADSKNWRDAFQRITEGADVEHVQLFGRLRANELVPFLELPTLKRLTLSTTRIDDDKAGVLATARSGIVID